MRPSESDLAREQELFQRCLETGPADRAALLDRECREDTELRARIERMIEFNLESGDSNSFLTLEGRDPDRIGPYRILQRLGEGGMGIVYAAEQREPVRRRVAIKVLRGGYGSREVLARFDVERQALSLMNHKNIARILDAGTTADHRPYIVMEYVPGEPITHYCRQHDLKLVERLKMFCLVCDAVQHAHQRGVIHRDLKPSNILITEEDGLPVPKIIDFGIAKAIVQPLTDQTLETKVGSLLGTPDYMSPEQAELSPLDVDTRADVYALGAVLYQLLTGVTPLQLAGSGNSYLQIQQQINERVPAPPSQLVSGPLRKALRGELDWITCKALEKQRHHRYPSAADFARDIHAFLEDRTVSAGPPSRIRSVHKFLRRHWFGSSAAVVIALVLAVSQVVVMQKNRELQRERDRANAEAATSAETTRFLLKVFEISEPGRARSGPLLARELLDRSRHELENSSQVDDAVLLQLYAGLGRAYEGLGISTDAAEMFQRALAALPDDAPPRERLALMAQLGDSLRTSFRTDDARLLLLDAVEFALQNGLQGDHLFTQIRLALAGIENDLGNVSEARRLFAAMYEESTSKGQPASPFELSLGVSLVDLLYVTAQLDQAEALAAELLPRIREQLGESHALVYHLLESQANLQLELGDYAQAERLIRSSHEYFESLYGADSERLQNTGMALARAQPDPAEGLRMVDAILQQQRNQFGADAPQTIPVLLIAGELHSRIRNDAAAAAHFSKALELAIANHGKQHLATAFASYYLATIRAREGDFSATLALLKSAAGVPLLQQRAARSPEFIPLHTNAEFTALLGSFAMTETDDQGNQQ